MSSVKLSEGVLVNIMLGEQVENPVMQILGCKRIPGSEGAADRFRLLVSDGKYMITFAMLAAQLNNIVVSNKLPLNTIIVIRRYITSNIQTNNKSDNRRILVILDLEVLVSGEEIEKMGDPESLSFEQLAALAKKDTPKESVSNGQGSNGNSGSAGLRGNLNTTTSNRNNTTASSSTMDIKTTNWHPIENINPYNPRWVIRARVTSKSGIRTWSNSKGEGKLFSMNVCDETGDIKVTAFNAEVDKFFDITEVDKVYFITGGNVKLANKQYNNTKNDYEITLSNDAQITECHDSENVPTLSYNFIPISSLSAIQDLTTSVDIIGICKDAGDVVELTSKSNKRLKKREISLLDQSNAVISLTLWGQDAEDFDGSSQPVIAIKGGRMNEYLGGKSLSTGPSSTFRVNPDIPEAHKLRGWYDNQGQHLDTTTNLSVRSGGGRGENAPFMTIEEAKAKQTLSTDGRLEFACLATIMLIKTDNCVYKACNVQGCSKKVTTDSDNNTYHCPKCNKTYDSFNYRLLMNMNIADFSGQVWVTCFTQDAEKILGKTSQEIGDMIDEHKSTAVEYIASRNFQQFVFKCRVTMETYNDEAKMRTVIMAIESANTAAVCNHIISKISALAGVDV